MSLLLGVGLCIPPGGTQIPEPLKDAGKVGRPCKEPSDILTLNVPLKILEPFKAMVPRGKRSEVLSILLKTYVQNKQSETEVFQSKLAEAKANVEKAQMDLSVLEALERIRQEEAERLSEEVAQASVKWVDLFEATKSSSPGLRRSVFSGKIGQPGYGDFDLETIEKMFSEYLLKQNNEGVKC